MLFEFGVLKPWGIYNESRACLDTAYFAKTENLLLKVL